MTGAGWIVYDRSVWRGFLLSRVLGDRARLIHADPSDVCEDVLAIATDAGGFIFHLDCTITERFPFCRQQLIDALLSTARIVLNHRAVDIRKTTIQRICAELSLPTTVATGHGRPDELVVVKTTLNSRGVAERLMPPRMRDEIGVSCPDTVISRWGYRVMRRGEVPTQWWHDPSLTVERFVANHSDVYYRVYVCRHNVAIACANRPGPIKKMVCGVTRDVQFVDLSSNSEFTQLDVAFPVRQVARFIERIGLNFGTLDVVRDDDPTFYIVDANTTPYWCEEIPGVLDHLTAGLSLD